MIAFAVSIIALFLPTGVLALFNNGGFEGGDFTGWTKSTYINNGLSGSQPFTGASIVRSAGGTNKTSVLGPFAPMSQTDANTGNVLHYPRSGQYSAVINYMGAGQNANSLKQQTTTNTGDIQPDGKIHVQFAWAAVADNGGGHAAEDQPYVYISLKNLTLSKLLYETFIVSGSGSIWQNGPGNIRFTDWQVMDIAPLLSDLDVGQTVEFEAIASGCDGGSHYGYLYVDGFGSSPPAPTATFTPGSGPVGASIAVAGTGWTASETISGVTVGGVTATHTLHIDGSGNLSGAITIPSVTGGAQSLVITGATSGPQPFTFTVATLSATTTALTSSLNPSALGQSVTFSATVSGAGNPTGTVTFYDGASSLGSANLSNGHGSLPTLAVQAGSRNITAVYSGDGNFSSSTSGILIQTVNQGPSVGGNFTPTDRLSVIIPWLALILILISGGALLKLSLRKGR